MGPRQARSVSWLSGRMARARDWRAKTSGPRVEGHVHAEVEDRRAVRAVGEVVRLHLVAHDAVEAAGEGPGDLRLAALPDGLDLGPGVGVEEGEASDAGRRLAEDFHGHDAAHGEPGEGEAQRGGDEDGGGEGRHAVVLGDGDEVQRSAAGEGGDLRGPEAGVAHHAGNKDEGGHVLFR